jgi:hypothetical protein
MKLTPPVARASVAKNPDGSLRITDRFAPPRHMGIDYSCVEGVSITAPVDGVAYVRTDTASGGRNNRSW